MVPPNSPRAKQLFAVTAFLIRTSLTLLVAGLLVAEANGFDVDFHNLTVRKLGLLVATVTPTEAAVSVPTESVERLGGQSVAKLTPGDYVLEVSNPEYRSWQRTVRIEAGRSAAFPFITLFRTTPTLLEERRATDNELRSPLIDPHLSVDNGEIWFQRNRGRRLISRFSDSVESATLLDQGHAAFLIHGTLHVIDVDGSNDQTLLVGVQGGSRLVARGEHDLGILSLNGQIRWYSIR